MQKYMATIRLCELFKGIDDDTLSNILTCLNAEIKSFSKGERIISAGETTEYAGVVISGKIHLENHDFLGNKSIVSEFLPGRTFCESYAFPGAGEVPFNVVAQENCSILLFNMRTLAIPCAKDCSRHRKLTQNLLQCMAGKHCEMNEKINHLTKRTTREKLISYLSEQAKKQKSTVVSVPFNRQELADYLAVERSAMSRELTKMKNDGIIDFKGNTFKLNI